MSKFIYSFSFLLLIQLLSSCAHIASPSGGAGDLTPPEIINVSVSQGELHFSKREIAITFNKYMNRNVVLENLTISPTINFTYRWSGKRLNIIFIDSFKQNTTYSIQIGGSFSDLRGNIAKEAFYTYFSTGDIIDSGKIQGKIITSKTEGYFVFCWLLKSQNSFNNFDNNNDENNNNDDSNNSDNSDNDNDRNNNNNIYTDYSIEPDSIDYFNKPPDYKTALGTTGNFTIPALKDGTYRVLAVKDTEKSGKISRLQDTIGFASFDPIVKNGISDFVLIYPQKVVDTIRPEISNISAINKNEIKIEFTKKIVLDSQIINSENNSGNLLQDFFYLQKENIDNENFDDKKIYPDAVSIENKIADNSLEFEQLKLSFLNDFAYNQQFVLHLNLDKDIELQDIFKNSLSFASGKIFSIDDTSSPNFLKILDFPLVDSARNIRLTHRFSMVLTNPIFLDSNNSEQIKLFDLRDTSEVELIFLQRAGNRIEFVAKSNLAASNWYQLQINCAGIKDIWGQNCQDSGLKILHFQTQAPLVKNKLYLQGTVKDTSSCKNRYLQLLEKNARDNSLTKKYITKIQNNNSYYFDDVLSGEYVVMFFCDLNDNGEFDAGELFPFSFSEPFKIVEKSVIIKERWSIDDYLIELE